MSARIVIDARWIFPEISGVGLYTRELIKALARAPGDLEYTLLFNDPGLRDRTLAQTGAAVCARMRTQLVPWGVFSLAGQWGITRWLRREAPAVFHSPNFMLPLPAFPRGGGGRTAALVTIHDVIPMLFPDHAPRSRKSRVFPLFCAIMRGIGRRADTILTVSAASRRDILTHLRIPPARAERVRVIYNGVDPAFRPAPRPPRAAAEPRVVLAVGRADPYKNLVALVRAFARLRTRAPFPVRLRIVGAPDPRYPEAPTLARALGLDDAVEWLGYLDGDALLRAYQTADVFGHPSRYEGFGLPLIEAMACGLPVVCGTGGAIPEVVADAALIADPGDPDGFADALATVLTDATRAEALRRAGLARARRFDWTRAAAETRAVYEALAATRGGRT